MDREKSPAEDGLNRIEVNPEVTPEDKSGGIRDFLKGEETSQGPSEEKKSEEREPEAGPKISFDIDSLVDLIAHQAALFKGKNEAERQSFVEKYKAVIPSYLKLFGLDKILEFLSINIKPLTTKEITLPAWIPLLIAAGIMGGGIFLIKADRYQMKQQPKEEEPKGKEKPDDKDSARQN